jgi:hypothetical protein
MPLWRILATGELGDLAPNTPEVERGDRRGRVDGRRRGGGGRGIGGFEVEIAVLVAFPTRKVR